MQCKYFVYYYLFRLAQWSNAPISLIYSECSERSSNPNLSAIAVRPPGRPPRFYEIDRGHALFSLFYERDVIVTSQLGRDCALR